MAALLRFFQRFDWMLLFATFVLFAFGISAIYSVELSRGAEEFILVKKQLIALALGAGIGLFVARTNYQLFRNYARGLYLLGVLLMVGVLVFGQELNGAKGWFVVPHVGALQPIEFMKIALITTLSRYFGEHAQRRFGWRDFFRSGIITAIPVGLAMQQPDLGGAILLVGIWLVMMFFAGARWSHFGVLAVSGIVALAIGWFFVFEDYQRLRIETFINPASDPLGTGYNVTQAKIAIGAGGVLGRGLGSGSQSQLRFLPESQADFVFAVIAEELGFIGIVVVLAAFGLLVARLLLLSHTTRDTFAAFLLLGIMGMFMVQATVHIGANLSLMPATGVPLPFVSYGGSSLLLASFAIGIAQSIAGTLTPGGRA